MSTTPAGAPFLERQCSDLRPRNHCMLRWITSLPLTFGFDTTPFGWFHDLNRGSL